ncbi:MAG: Flp pilus assembly protein, ATPase CpaF [Acidobacteria bacterium]|nr:Flp pilus assembly protein, ATPase CpaF [Acidobacteriota bacterium]
MATMTTQGSPDFSALKTVIHRKLILKLNLDRLPGMDQEAVKRDLAPMVEELAVAEATPMTLQEREKLCKEVLDEIFGLGPLEPLLKDPTVSDILVNTYKRVYVERKGLLEQTSIQFRDDAHVMAIIDRIVSAVGPRAVRRQRQCGHSAAGAGRPLPLDSAVRAQAAAGGPIDPESDGDAGND